MFCNHLERHLSKLLEAKKKLYFAHSSYHIYFIRGDRINLVQTINWWLIDNNFMIPTLYTSKKLTWSTNMVFVRTITNKLCTTLGLICNSLIKKCWFNTFPNSISLITDFLFKKLQTQEKSSSWSVANCLFYFVYIEIVLRLIKY